MTAAHGWRRLLRIWRRDPATDIDAELRFHLDARIADLVARGMSPDAARHQAIAEFGDVDAVRAKLSEIDTRLLQKRRRADGWERAAQDVQYLVRGLRRSPGFTAAVALTLALGIGANGAVFTLLDRIFFRPPAGVTAPGSVRRLHHVYMDQRQHTVETRPVFSYPEVRALRAAVPESIAIAAYTNAKVSVGDGPAARRGNVVYALGDYFRALGVRPAAGRFFTPDESRIETSIPVAVISYRLWMDQFGGDARALTQSIELAGHRYSIIGVAPPPFRGIDLDAADAWAPRPC